MLDKFASHFLDGDEPQVNTAVKEKATELDILINSQVADCREKDIALTKLEEAVMWATKGLAINGVKK